MLEEALGENKACATVGKLAALGSLVRFTQIVWLRGVELAKQTEQGVPEEVDIRLNEDEPFCRGVCHVCLIYHGQVLEAVELEGPLLLLDGLPALVCLLVLDIDLEVHVVLLVALGEFGEDVDNMAVAQSLFPIPHDDEVRNAARYGAEVCFGLVCAVRGHLEDDLHLFE